MRKTKLTDLIALTFAYAKWEAILFIFFAVISGVAPVVLIKVTADFVNLGLASAKSGMIFKELYFQAALLVITVTFQNMAAALTYLVTERIKLKIHRGYRIILLEKCASVQYKYIEDSKTWDLLSRVMKEPEKFIVEGFGAFFQILNYSINVIGFMYFIATAVWWAAFTILLCCVPLFYISIKSGKAHYDINREVAKIERKYTYLSEVLTEREYVDERTLFGYGKRVNKAFYDTYQRAVKIRVKREFQWFFKTQLGGILTSTAGIAVVVILLGPTIKGAISVGLFIALVNAIFNLTGSLSWGLSEAIDALFRGREFVKDLDQFFLLDETKDGLCAPEEPQDVQRIEFRDVSFTYPWTGNQILKNVTFTMEKGKHYALVGSNGAGKTTMVKLLTGMYTEYTGQILINEKELREYKTGELKAMFSVVYQDFAKYWFTIGENIAVGDISQINDPLARERIEKAIDMVEMSETVGAVPRGPNTPLGKIHADGVDLSGGEWQRLAMARAIFRPAPIRIMDEPTAALDPISESKIYELFDKISQHTLTIFISHRLGSTKIADEILVFEDGGVVEQGTYESLMDKKGLYFTMFEQQRGWYR